MKLSAGFQLSIEPAAQWLRKDQQSFSLSSSDGLSRRIVFNASLTSFTGTVEISAYAASKGAVAQLTKALTNEWRSQGITVSAIAPGYIETELTSTVKGARKKREKV